MYSKMAYFCEGVSSQIDTTNGFEIHVQSNLLMWSLVIRDHLS